MNWEKITCFQISRTKLKNYIIKKRPLLRSISISNKISILIFIFAGTLFILF